MGGYSISCYFSVWLNILNYTFPKTILTIHNFSSCMYSYTSIPLWKGANKHRNWKASIRFGGMRLLGMSGMSSQEEERMYVFLNSWLWKVNRTEDSGRSQVAVDMKVPKEKRMLETWRKLNWWHLKEEMHPEDWAKGVGSRYADGGTGEEMVSILSVSLLVETSSKNKGIEVKAGGRYGRTTKGKEGDLERSFRRLGGVAGMVLGTQSRWETKSLVSPIHVRNGCLWKCPVAAQVKGENRYTHNFLWKKQTITSFFLSCLL